MAKEVKDQNVQVEEAMELTTQEEKVVKLFEGHEVVSETAEYVVIKEDGKFKRKAKYKEFNSFVAETKEDKLFLFNALNSNDESGNGLKDHVGKQFQVKDVILRPYDKINEDTGATEYGVLTYLITPEKVAYATSSKNVYFTVVQLMEAFGTPSWDDMFVQVGKKKMENGDTITIKPV